MCKAEWRLAFLMVLGTFVLGACNGLKLFHSTDDKAITTGIQAKLFSDPILKTRDVHVDSRNGIVTLSGTVNTDLEKSAVERITTQEEGVKNVVDLMSVASQTATPTPEGVQTAESAPPPQQVAPPQEQPAPQKPRHTHHAKPPVNDGDQATSELEAYTNSVAPAAAGNPNPTPASPPTPIPAPAAVATPAAAAPPQVATPPAPAVPAAPAPKPHVTIPGGTVVTIRMIDSIDSSQNRTGEEFAATVDSPVVVSDRVVVSRGADARVRLVNAQSAGHISGQSELQLELISLTINGVSYPTTSGYYQQHGSSRGTRTAETVGGGAVLGALIGGLLGHGKGAAIGSVAGAGAGTAVQVSTKGQQVKVPAETKLDFTLKDPVTVTTDAGN